MRRRHLPGSPPEPRRQLRPPALGLAPRLSLLQRRLGGARIRRAGSSAGGWRRRACSTRSDEPGGAAPATAGASCSSRRLPGRCCQTGSRRRSMACSRVGSSWSARALSPAAPPDCRAMRLPTTCTRRAPRRGTRCRGSPPSTPNICSSSTALPSPSNWAARCRHHFDRHTVRVGVTVHDPAPSLRRPMLPGRVYTFDDIGAMIRRRAWVIVVPVLLAAAVTGVVLTQMPRPVPVRHADSGRASTSAGELCPGNRHHANRGSTAVDQPAAPEPHPARTDHPRLRPLSRDRQSMPMEDVVERMRARHPGSDRQRRRVPRQLRRRFAGRGPEGDGSGCRRCSSRRTCATAKCWPRPPTNFSIPSSTDARRRLVEQEQQLAQYRVQHAGQLPSQLQSNLQAAQNLQVQAQGLVDSTNRDRDRRLVLERTVMELESRPRAAGGATGRAWGRTGRAIARRAARIVAAVGGRAAGAAETPAPRHGPCPPARSANWRSGSPPRRRPLAGLVPPCDRRAADSATARDAQGRDGDARPADRRKRATAAECCSSRSAGYDARIAAVPARESELASLTRDYDTLQKVYADLLSKREQSKVAANLERRQIGEQFTVLDPARLPEKPFSPNRPLVLLIGLIAGLVLGGGLAGWLEYPRHVASLARRRRRHPGAAGARRRARPVSHASQDARHPSRRTVPLPRRHSERPPRSCRRWEAGWERRQGSTPATHQRMRRVLTPWPSGSNARAMPYVFRDASHGADRRARTPRACAWVARPATRIVASPSSCINSASRDPCRVLMVASAEPGEGKSLTAANLAVALERIVSQARAAGRRGFAQTDAAHAVRGEIRARTERQLLNGHGVSLQPVRMADTLSLLSAGDARSNPLVTLTSTAPEGAAGAAGAARRLGHPRRPAAGGFPDAHVLASLADGVVLVVGAGQTPLAAVEAAVKMLGRERIVGIVLNRSTASAARATTTRQGRAQGVLQRCSRFFCRA